MMVYHLYQTRAVLSTQCAHPVNGHKLMVLSLIVLEQTEVM